MQTEDGLPCDACGAAAGTASSAGAGPRAAVGRAGQGGALGTPGLAGQLMIGQDDVWPRYRKASATLRTERVLAVEAAPAPGARCS